MFGNSVSRAYHDFPGHGSHAYPGKFNRSPLRIQYPKLVFILRQFQEGRRVTGPFRWACAQDQHGPGLKASMGLGSRPVWALGSRCCTAAMKGDIEGLSIRQNGPKLTHLFFADDYLIFCRSTLEVC